LHNHKHYLYDESSGTARERQHKHHNNQINTNTMRGHYTTMILKTSVDYYRHGCIDDIARTPERDAVN
jgi:hypothetical protein